MIDFKLYLTSSDFSIKIKLYFQINVLLFQFHSQDVFSIFSFSSLICSDIICFLDVNGDVSCENIRSLDNNFSSDNIKFTNRFCYKTPSINACYFLKSIDKKATPYSFSLSYPTEVYSEPCQIFKMEFFQKDFNSILDI